NELFDFGKRRRDDGQTVAPFVLVKEPVHLVEAAGEHDVTRAGLRTELYSCGWRGGEPIDHALERNAKNVGPKLLGALYIDMPGHNRQRQIRHSQSDRGRRRLTHESLAYQRNAGDPGSLGNRAGPQHGGRTATSTSHT